MPYAPPQLPLRAYVWYEVDDEPAGIPPDATLDISLSPIRPEDFLRGTTIATPVPVTHIIRALANNLFRDNLYPGHPPLVWPCTLFECPLDSGHYYATLWAHQVGAGFPNWHSRIYAARIHQIGYDGTPPRFIGYV
jgi:hypothetical protein